jgi:hypothetical protein
MMDTLRYADKLEALGISHEQAKGMAKALNEELKESTITKADLATAVAELKGEMNANTAKLRGEIGTSSSKLEVKIIAWQIGISLGLFGALFAALHK